MPERPAILGAGNLVSAFFPSPVGRLKLVARDDSLVALLWENDSPRRVRLAQATEDADHPVLALAARQLTEYFQRHRATFDIPLAATGTPFQLSVWHALQTIPYGETRTYAAIARQIGHPTAMRAVGAANGRNPISIIVPCHRVVGASGALTGFAGGLANKRILLDLEAPAAPLLGQAAAARGLSSRSPMARS